MGLGVAEVSSSQELILGMLVLELDALFSDLPGTLICKLGEDRSLVKVLFSHFNYQIQPAIKQVSFSRL